MLFLDDDRIWHAVCVWPWFSKEAVRLSYAEVAEAFQARWVSGTFFMIRLYQLCMFWDRSLTSRQQKYRLTSTFWCLVLHSCAWGLECDASYKPLVPNMCSSRLPPVFTEYSHVTALGRYKPSSFLRSVFSLCLTILFNTEWIYNEFSA